MILRRDGPGHGKGIENFSCLLVHVASIRCSHVAWPRRTERSTFKEDEALAIMRGMGGEAGGGRAGD